MEVDRPLATRGQLAVKALLASQLPAHAPPVQMRVHELFTAAVRALMRQTVPGGWTTDENVELLRQRWLAEPLAS